LFGLCLALLCIPAAAENWNQFRGPNLDGISASKSVPAHWAEDKNIAWKVKVPGVAWSQPVTWGDKIFLTTAIADEQKKPKSGDWAPGVGALSALLPRASTTKPSASSTRPSGGFFASFDDP